MTGGVGAGGMKGDTMAKEAHGLELTDQEKLRRYQPWSISIGEKEFEN